MDNMIVLLLSGIFEEVITSIKSPLTPPWQELIKCNTLVDKSGTCLPKWNHDALCLIEQVPAQGAKNNGVKLTSRVMPSIMGVSSKLGRIQKFNFDV